jgi:hypothetical protein
MAHTREFLQPKYPRLKFHPETSPTGGPGELRALAGPTGRERDTRPCRAALCVLLALAGGPRPGEHARAGTPCLLLAIYRRARVIKHTGIFSPLLLDAVVSVAMAVFLCFLLALLVSSCSAASAGGERCVRQGKAAYAPSPSPLLPQGRRACRSIDGGRPISSSRESRFRCFLLPPPRF